MMRAQPLIRVQLLVLGEPVDCNPPGSSVHGISQARILEWVAIFSSRGSSQPRDQTCVSDISCVGRQILYYCTSWEAMCLLHCRWLLLPLSHQGSFSNT